MGILKKVSKPPEEKAMNVSLPRKTPQFKIQNQNESLRAMFLFRNSCMEAEGEEERRRCCGFGGFGGSAGDDETLYNETGDGGCSKEGLDAGFNGRSGALREDNKSGGFDGGRCEFDGLSSDHEIRDKDEN
ncbi:unnamed protein product [Vicia faba]|uniref:Uncharacterized protein n=1 Tax=Vicia faba TaxID=3906 RepID=A0AAV1AZ92_VICFA|nr:unnamed protein product [Vicia faba]